MMFAEMRGVIHIALFSLQLVCYMEFLRTG